MNELPSKMPPPTTRVPRMFNIWGTLVYAACSFTAFCFMVAFPFGVRPPLYVVLPCLSYVFISSGIIALGRIENNRDAQFWIETARRVSELNKRKMN